MATLVTVARGLLINSSGLLGTRTMTRIRKVSEKWLRCLDIVQSNAPVVYGFAAVTCLFPVCLKRLAKDASALLCSYRAL